MYNYEKWEESRRNVYSFFNIPCSPKDLQPHGPHPNNLFHDVTVSLLTDIARHTTHPTLIMTDNLDTFCCSVRKDEGDYIVVTISRLWIDPTKYLAIRTNPRQVFEKRACRDGIASRHGGAFLVAKELLEYNLCRDLLERLYPGKPKIVFCEDDRYRKTAGHGRR